jgi:hypothetical protein
LVPVARGYSVYDTARFTRDNLVSIGSTQDIAFYGLNTNVVVVRHQLGSTMWEFNQTNFKPNNAADGHDKVNIGVNERVPLFQVETRVLSAIQEGRLVPRQYVNRCLLTDPSLEDYACSW